MAECTFPDVAAHISLLLFETTVCAFLYQVTYGDWMHSVHFLPFYKGDKFCDALFAFLHTKSLLKRVYSKKHSEKGLL